jgi:6-pyruvoyltetrahydropterin/6-carboxytetrahydropterin synthase
MIVSREIGIDYGHTLPNHFSFCNQLHGHRARVIAEVDGEIVTKDNDSSQGMVLDFKILKQKMMEKLHDVLDHGFAVWKDDKEDLEYIKKRNSKYLITDEPPTAEFLAKWAFNQLKDEFPENIKLVKITWYETPNSYAVYEE